MFLTISPANIIIKVKVKVKIKIKVMPPVGTGLDLCTEISFVGTGLDLCTEICLLDEWMIG